MLSKLKKIYINNKQLLNNILGSFLVKGSAMVVTLFMLPAYIKFFENEKILGVWFTILSVLNWVLAFDLGVGNGLRNKLTISLAQEDTTLSKKIISSSYMMVGIFSIFVIIVSSFTFPFLNWNMIFAVSESVISKKALLFSVEIAFIGIMIQFFLKLINSILYSIQKSAINNFLALLSNIVILLFILFIPTTTPEKDLIVLSFINVLAVNIPLLITSIVLFCGKLKDLRPNFKFFSKNIAINILKIGLLFFFLQFASVVLGNTNEFLISHFIGNEAVVEYQPYYKLTNVFVSIFGLALTPVWSAVTKKMGEKDFKWIYNTYKLLLFFSFLFGILMLLLIPLMPIIVKIWLGESFAINNYFTLCFILFSFCMIWNSVNSVIANGLEKLKAQVIFLTLGAVINVPLSYVLCSITHSWISIVVANIISLLPICVIQPFYLKKEIKKCFRNEDF